MIIKNELSNGGFHFFIVDETLSKVLKDLFISDKKKQHIANFKVTTFSLFLKI